MCNSINFVTALLLSYYSATLIMLESPT